MKQITLLSACLTLTSWCGLAATASAQDSNIQTMPLCPGGEVIELDGQAVCAKTDTLNLLIEDFEAAELEFDIFRRGQEGDRDAQRLLPDNSLDALTASNLRQTNFLARHAALSTQPMNETDRLNY